MKVSSFVALIVSCICFVSVAGAQVKKPTGKMPSGPAQKTVLKSKFPPGLTPPIVPRARMLGFGDIAKDCGLSAVAAKKCKAELEKTVSQKGKSGGVETVAELTKQRDARVIASLTPPQKQRLTELSYQAIGILAVRCDSARKALAITPAQEKKMLDTWAPIFKKARAEAMKMPRPVIDKKDPKKDEKVKEAYKKHDAVYDRAKAECEAITKASILTPAQWVKWTKMKGRIYPLSYDQKL